MRPIHTHRTSSYHVTVTMDIYQAIVLIVLIPGAKNTAFRGDYYRFDERYNDMLPVSDILWTKSTNLLSCGIQCYNYTDCESFFYGNGHCYGYIRKLHDLVTTTAAIGIKYYEMAGPVGNIAAGKRTMQSSFYLNDPSFGSANAVDNRRYPVQDAPTALPSCSHTQGLGGGDSKPFWEVDLLELYRITSTSFLSRIECCGERNTGLNITVAETSSGPYVLCFYYPPGPGFVGEMKTFYCTQPLIGRLVRISREEDIINFCEIEVYGYPWN